MAQNRRGALALALTLAPAACASPPADHETSGGPAGLATGASQSAATSDGSTSEGEATSDGSASASATDVSDGTSGGATEPSTTEPTTTDPSTTTSTTTMTSTTGDLPPAIPCELRSTTYGAAMQELMVAKGAPERLLFTVEGLPAPELVAAATLRFTSYDADHPGEEGSIFVNEGPPIELPADLAWENLEHQSEVDIHGQTIAGANEIAFGAGTFAGGTFYRIGAVAIEALLHVDACPGADDLPDGPPVAVQLDYNDATYSARHNWVLRCDFQDGYAFTAKGDQAGLDCGDLYSPDGTRAGTATFTFKDLPKAIYEVSIKSRHTTNRNPKGALFVVDGEGKRIPQKDDQDFVVDVWGQKELAGTVDVVLDSTMENESDCVTWVRLDPI